MNEYILMEKNHRTRRAIRPLTLALIQQHLKNVIALPCEMTTGTDDTDDVTARS